MEPLTENEMLRWNVTALIVGLAVVLSALIGAVTWHNRQVTRLTAETAQYAIANGMTPATVIDGVTYIRAECRP